MRLRPAVPIALFLLCSLISVVPAVSAEPVSLQSNFHRLVLLKQGLEKKHGLTRLECFPFLKAIKDQKEEVEWVARCLTGVQTLKQALETVPDHGLRTIGISSRFLRTGGFSTMLVQWDAPLEEMVRKLKDRPSAEEQQALLKQVKELKRRILTRFFIRDLYCSQTLSNEQCLQGYTTLASVEPKGKLAEKSWGRVVISDTLIPGEDPTTLLLGYNQSAEQLAGRLLNVKSHDFWDQRRRDYETMAERHGKVFKRVLQAPNVFCEPELTSEECLQGAALLHQLSEKPGMGERPWGKVWINRYLTRVRNDYDVALRFDSPVEEAQSILVQRPTGPEVAAHVTASGRYEEKLKNNSSGLRAVCDLHRLRSDLCVKGFETFVEFLKTHRDFKISPPWDNLMFIDATQLDRVNFALNSSSRDTYIYVDARTDLKELTQYLRKYQTDVD